MYIKLFQFIFLTFFHIQCIFFHILNILHIFFTLYSFFLWITHFFIHSIIHSIMRCKYSFKEFIHSKILANYSFNKFIHSKKSEIIHSMKIFNWKWGYRTPLVYDGKTKQGRNSPKELISNIVFGLLSLNPDFCNCKHWAKLPPKLLGNDFLFSFKAVSSDWWL